MRWEWAAIGGSIAVILLSLQILQVKRLTILNQYSGWAIAFHFFCRMSFFSGFVILALRQSAINGLIFFGGYWMVRSLLLVCLGSGQFRGLFLENN